MKYLLTFVVGAAFGLGAGAAYWAHQSTKLVGISPVTFNIRELCNTDGFSKGAFKELCKPDVVVNTGSAQ